MNQNKGIVGLGLIVAIVLGIVVVGGGAYYLGRGSNRQEVKNPENILPIVDNNQLLDEKSGLTIYESKTFGYSIGYSGIDVKYVYVEGNGEDVRLFPNQSNIDNLEIVNSSYVAPSYMVSAGTVTFGINQFKKFVDNITPRHTYYLKSGLKNNKSILISIEGDSNLPNYLDLASLKINAIDSEESTTEVFSRQPGAIKSIKSDGLNKWIFAVDLLTYNSGWVPGVTDMYSNQNTKIRNLNVTNSTKTYGCVSGPDGGGPNLSTVPNANTANYISEVQKNITEVKSSIKYRVGGKEVMTDWQTLSFDINGTNIIAIYTQCLP